MKDLFMRLVRVGGNITFHNEDNDYKGVHLCPYTVITTEEGFQYWIDQMPWKRKNCWTMICGASTIIIP